MSTSNATNVATSDQEQGSGRAALVLSGGGSRGAYEVGVLSYLFEEVIPALPSGFQFDIVSGTSVGAIHAAYVVATAHLDGPARAKTLVDVWKAMRVDEIFKLSGSDLLGIPMRALGLGRRPEGDETGDSVGGLVDFSPLERLVADQIPWDHLPANLTGSRPRALCVSCTEVRNGLVTVFMDGPLADPAPWAFDPNARAVRCGIEGRHVRASAAIPFLFPSVRIGERYYVDGGLRMNTPLSPALRLGADRVLVIALKHKPDADEDAPAYPVDVIAQPAFLLGKVLDALLLDQLEYELRRIEVVNGLLEHGRGEYGEDFGDRINVAVSAQRGVSYRPVAADVIRPSQDVGKVAADCYRSREGTRSLGVLPTLIAKATLRGVPEEEADLLSYLYFDSCFTTRLIDLGREDARAMRDDILELFS